MSGGSIDPECSRCSPVAGDDLGRVGKNAGASVQEAGSGPEGAEDRGFVRGRRQVRTPAGASSSWGGRGRRRPQGPFSGQGYRPSARCRSPGAQSSRRWWRRWPRNSKAGPGRDLDPKGRGLRSHRVRPVTPETRVLRVALASMRARVARSTFAAERVRPAAGPIQRVSHPARGEQPRAGVTGPEHW
jgi:hypothetical protein